MINTSSRGDAPLSSENFPIAKYANRITMTQAITHVIRADRNTMKRPTVSYFGGPRSSSVVRLSMFSVIVDIGVDDEKCSYRNKYIRNIQNGKIFNRDKVYHMSDENTLICMRDRSRKYSDICRIEKSRVFRILFSNIKI